MRLFELEDMESLIGRRLKQAYAFPKRAPKAEPPLMGNSDEMNANVGKNFKLKNDDDTVYRAVGVQQDYKGDLMYRAVVADSEEQAGQLFPPNYVRFLNGLEDVPFPTDGQ